ncbi:hypothetical protein [Yoonia sp.]|uniref:hypothetical protein n=1 Tax=Yoonia sp. TaxID=2212373 RepID=UPI0025CD2628|nr:hypothetical protein [Yoonia sp.]
MNYPDKRLSVLMQIKEARQTASRLRLSEAMDVETQRRTAEGRAQDHYDHCSDVADNYVRARFEEAADVRNMGRFIEGVALGNFGARRDASRAKLVIERVAYRRNIATQDRERAAKKFLADMRSKDALEKVLQDQRAQASTHSDMIEDETMQELSAARNTNGKA